MNQREIKFRAWNIAEKRWDNIRSEYSEGEGAKNYFSVDKEFVRFNRGDIVIQQFTGLKDKNGKEIYEGDIVEYENGGGDKIDSNGNPMKYEVKFEDGCFLASGLTLDNYFDGLEVIGNIYSNPELLK